MVTSCSAVGCKRRATKGNHITFHRFPVKPELRKKWIEAVKRKNFEPTRNSRLCEKHFTPESYVYFTDKKRLKEDAVPVIFDFSGFVKNGQPKIQKLNDPEQIHCIQFVDANCVKNELIPNQSKNRTVIVIDNVIKARRVEKGFLHDETDNATQRNVDNATLPVIKSCFSLTSSIPVVSITPQSPVPRIPDIVLSSDCTQKRLIGKTLQMKKKYKERLEVMNQVNSELKKRKAFLENLLIRIKEKQLTSDEDVTDLMDCFVMEEGEEDTMESDEDDLVNADEYQKTIAFIDGKIRKFERAIDERSTSLPKTSECEAFGLQVESVLTSMPVENATAAKNQIMEELKKYQGKILVKMYEEFNKTFSGLENIEMNENDFTCN